MTQPYLLHLFTPIRNGQAKHIFQHRKRELPLREGHHRPALLRLDFGQRYLAQLHDT